MTDKYSKSLLDQILDENEKALIAGFTDNVVLREAVRKVLLASVYYNGVLLAGVPADPTRNYLLALTNRRELSDEQLGRETRATAEGVAMIEAGFSALAIYQTETKEAKVEENPAR